MLLLRDARELITIFRCRVLDRIPERSPLKYTEQYDPYDGRLSPIQTVKSRQRSLKSISPTTNHLSDNAPSPTHLCQSTNFKDSHLTCGIGDCATTFNGKNAVPNRKRHIKEQHEGSKFLCTVCGKAYSRDNYRLKHQGRCKGGALELNI